LVLCCFMGQRAQRNIFFYHWSQRMRHDDAFILSGFLECSCPVLRRKVVCLYSLIVLKYDQISFPKKPVVRGLQRTIRESLLVAGSMGEIFNYTDNSVLLGLRYTGKQKNELYQHLNRAYEHQVELFFAFSALLFGAQTTKQAYGRFRQGTDFTRANVVEFFRAGELQSVVSPMLNLLNISIPRDMVPFVIKELKLEPDTVVIGLLMKREGFEWLEYLMESALLGGPHKENIENYHKEHHYFNYLSPQDYVSLVKKLTQNGPRVNPENEKQILNASLSLPPASLSALQARYRENA
jgi:hypothetical protein